MVGRLSFDRHGGSRAWRDERTALSADRAREGGGRYRERQLSASFAKFIRHVFTQCFG
jgi:hypothetical protein